MAIENKDNRLEILEILLGAGALINPSTEHKRHAALHAAVENADVEMTTMLLRKGAYPNLDPSASTYRTLLQEAAHRGHVELIQLLLDYGADVNAPGY